MTGRPYRGWLANFGQVVLGLDPKASKYKPSWRRGVYLGKDSAGHDVLGVGSDEVIRTKALRRTANLWSAEEALLLNIGLWDTTGYTYSQAKIHPLPPVLPHIVDQVAMDVAAYQGASDEEGEESQHVQARVQDALPEVGLLDDAEEAVPAMSAAGMDMDTTVAGGSTSDQL